MIHSLSFLFALILNCLGSGLMIRSGVQVPNGTGTKPLNNSFSEIRFFSLKAGI